MSLNILDVTSSDIVSIALNEEDFGKSLSWLVLKIKEELQKALLVPDGKKASLQRLYIGTKDVLSDRSPHTIEYYLVDGEPWLMNSILTSAERITITVSSDSARYQYKVGKGVTIERFKRALCEQNIMSGSTRLWFKGDVLDNDKTFEQCDIESGDVVEIFLEQIGGGCAGYSGGGGDVIEFADISETSALKRKPWSLSAPRWRLARPGLCIEGRCTNWYCEAYSKYVIVNVGIGDFDLETDCRSSTCPMCREHVDVATCAFNNCRWKWVGKKVVSPSQPPVVVRGDWKEADNAYHRFEERESGKAQWLLLKITTEDMESTSSDQRLCAVCLAFINKPEKTSTLPCNHTYHSQCIAEWLERSTTCPLCRAAASMTTLMKKAAGLHA